MEYGLECQEGVSYNEMIDYLKTKNWNNVDSPAFRQWFYKNFFCQKVYSDHYHEHPLNSLAILSVPIERKYDKEKASITGDAYFKYIEYLHIRTALRNARLSTIIAYIALFIPVIIGLMQILIAKNVI